MSTEKPKRARIQPTPALREPISPEWREWGPYLSERQWGTVREDYSEFGEAWDFFPHDHARSRAYRWGEDGILGISDKDQLLCFSLALWNGADPILKERMFGVTGSQGNHGEDVKEYYYYLDASPTHSYLKGLYKYPQQAYPYTDLLETNRNRSRQEPEYELIDTGLFDEDRYFDVFVEYAKATPTDIVIRVSATNHGPDPASLEVLPTLWFRNTWSWGRDDRRPSLTNATAVDSTVQLVRAKHPELGDYWLSCEGSPELLFTENETNSERLFGGENRTPFVKDGINAAVVDGNLEAVNPDKTGTKVAARYRLDLGPGETRQIHLRLSARKQKTPFAGVDGILQSRIRECDALYENVSQSTMTEDERRVQRQALAGMIWSKQFFYFHVDEWLEGDPAGPTPPEVRKQGRNSKWRLHRSHDIISMPDKWEYPWYAAWDLAFHCIPLALVDPEFAKHQLLLLTTERFMHPNGQLPAYEWAFGDVNPPVHIAAACALFRADQTHTGVADHDFLARLFHKLLINFTWWVNRKDEGDRNVFEGGFLGLDNISVIDRSQTLPPGLSLEQADGTAWMATYCLGMTWAAAELARENPVYNDLVVKFMDHYLLIARSLNGFGKDHQGLWDEEDGFFYDTVRRSDGSSVPLRLRSLVGLLPIATAVHFTLSQADMRHFADIEIASYLDNARAQYPNAHRLFPVKILADGSVSQLLTLVPEDRLRRILERMLDPDEFLSDFGIRSVSKVYGEHPYRIQAQGQELEVAYEPAESSSGMFGGNSNWRGPIWMPMNFLLIQGLRNLHAFYGDEFVVEYPTRSGEFASLGEVAKDLSRRLSASMLRNAEGKRPVFGAVDKMQNDPNWRDNVLFYEYFHGDNGAGIGASHQTGWTGLVASLLDNLAKDITV